jgi:AraC-like DNA-binding protein
MDDLTQPSVIGGRKQLGMKSNSPHDLFGVRESLKTFEADSAAYRRLFDAISKILPFTQGVVISTMPRIGTQILQPSSCPESFLKAYSRDLYAHDRPTWQTVLTGQPVSSGDLWNEQQLEATAFYRGLMQPFGLQHLAAAKLTAPLLRGYPGSLHLYRSGNEPPFSSGEVKLLGAITHLIDEAIENLREPRRKAACGKAASWDNAGNCREFLFDASGRPQSLYTQPHMRFDQRLVQDMRHEVPRRFAHLNGEMVTSSRIELTDSLGESRIFRTTFFKQFPALGEGPFLFFALQPEACEWVTVRATDLQADPEMARLIPAMKFMHQEFARNPTLNETAAKVRLSPFHFHRRFTDLFGLTPKHFMLACQVHKAKTMLLERRESLANIAAQCGFAHQSHFTSRFKQATGLTPTRWRRVASDMHAMRGGTASHVRAGSASRE